MEQVLRSIYQERASNPETLAVLFIEKREEADPITDTFDALLLIITANASTPIYTKHYSSGSRKAAMHVISEKQLWKWLRTGTNRKIIDWLFYGKIYFDRNEYIEKLKKELRDFPDYGRKIKMGLEFSKLVRAYIEGKSLFDQGNHMDAYNHVVNSLHYLARLAVIDKGFYPEVTVWSQIKKIDPAIYKLYEELITSDEPLKKRLELLYLASDFFIYHRTTDGIEHILQVMSTKELWEIQDLHESSELEMYSTNLELFIEFLVDKGFILVVQNESKNNLIAHRYYKVSHAHSDEWNGERDE